MYKSFLGPIARALITLSVILEFNIYTYETHVTYNLYYVITKQRRFYEYCIVLIYCFSQLENWSSNLLQTS